MLIVRVRLFSEWEIAPIEDHTASLPIGKTGKQTWRISCRRMGTEGLRLPESVKAAGPLEASFVGPATVQEQSGGVAEATRNVEVTLPAIPELGSRAAELTFLWPDGLKKTHLIRWEIAPRVRMAPSSIVVESSEQPIEKTVAVTSDDGPFRIIKVAGALLSATVEASAAAARTHHLTLRLGPARVAGGGVSNIMIRTDHPHQPELSLRVLILPAEHQD